MQKKKLSVCTVRTNLSFSITLTTQELTFINLNTLNILFKSNLLSAFSCENTGCKLRCRYPSTTHWSILSIAQLADDHYAQGHFICCIVCSTWKALVIINFVTVQDLEATLFESKTNFVWIACTFKFRKRNISTINKNSAQNKEENP